MLLHPIIGLLNERPATGVELFGIAPDPIALVTVGLLLLLPGRMRWLALPIPLAWTLVSGLTFLAMEIPLGLLTPGVAFGGVVAKWWVEPRRKRGPWLD